MHGAKKDSCVKMVSQEELPREVIRLGNELAALRWEAAKALGISPDELPDRDEFVPDEEIVAEIRRLKAAPLGHKLPAGPPTIVDAAALLGLESRLTKIAEEAVERALAKREQAPDGSQILEMSPEEDARARRAIDEWEARRRKNAEFSDWNSKPEFDL